IIGPEALLTRTARGRASLSRLLDVIEEAEHALLEPCRGGFVIVGHAVVREQVSIAGIEEELRALDRLDELAGDIDIAPVVGFHGVDLEGNAARPLAAELGERYGAVQEQGSLRAGAGLGQ